MTSEDDRPTPSAPDVGPASDVTVDREQAADAPEPGAWNAATTTDPDAMQGTPDELGGTGGANAGGAG